MRSTIIAILFIVLAATVTGCTSAPDQEAPGAASAAPTVAQTFDLGELSYIFEVPAEPVDVAVTLETAGTVEALIPLEGGSISATGADGTVYTLEIPSDALLNETMISLTPVTSVADMPFGGEQTYAVQLGPDGLFLQDFAILTITPAVEIPIEEQIVFGYLSEGSDLILAAPVVDSSEIKINVLHFSGNGVTKGLLADIEPERQRLGGDAERRLRNAVNEALGKERQRQLLGGGEEGGEDLQALFAEAFRQFEEQVIKPRLAAAGESCANGQLAIQTVLGYERQRQLLGMGDSGYMADLPDLLETAARVCVIEEFELCVEEHIIHRMIPVWLGFERQFQLLGIPEGAALREARDLTEKCLTFRLELESTGTMDLSGSGYDSTVTSEITLRFNADDLKISGEAPLVNTEYEFRMAGCNVTSTRGGGTFAVFDLIYEAAPGASSEYNSGPAVFGHITDLSLNYHHGNSTESATANCPNMGPLTLPLPAWSAAFIVTHIDEVGETGWITRDWEMQGGELFAEKEWSLANAEISEEGSFELHHTPGE